MRFAALCVAGAVGFVVVVIGGALLTLAIVAPPSEVGAGATLCFVGPVVANCCNASAIRWINFFFGICLVVVSIQLTLCILLLRVELA